MEGPETALIVSTHLGLVTRGKLGARFPTNQPTSGSTISIMMIFDTPGVRAGRVLSRMWRQAASGQSWRMWLRR